MSCFLLVTAHKWDNVSLQMQPVYNDDLVEYVSFCILSLSSSLFTRVPSSNGFIPGRLVAWAEDDSSQLACTLLLLFSSVGSSNTSFFHIKPYLAAYDLLTVI